MLANLESLSVMEIASESDLTAEELIARGEKLIAIGRELQTQAALLRNESPPKPLSRPAGPSGDHSVTANGLIDTEAATVKARALGTFTRLQFEDALATNGPQTTKWLAALLKTGTITRETAEDGAIAYRYCRPADDEPAEYQLRVWAAEQTEPFDVEQAADGTGLPTEDIEQALPRLIGDLTVAPVTVEAVDDLGELEKLGETFFRYQPEIPNGLSAELERRRLSAVNSTPQVKRGTPVRIRTERRNARARSTPGSRQKVINQDRNWERLQAAKAEREEQNRVRAQRERDRPKSRRKPKASKPVT
jgi:hypothetical protein